MDLHKTAAVARTCQWLPLRSEDMTYAEPTELHELRSALHAASGIAFALTAAPSGEQAGALAAALRRALDSARALEDGVSETGTGCPQHPRGAVDPLHGDRENPLPPGWGRCLLCNDRRRRAGAVRRPPRWQDRAAEVTTRAAAPLPPSGAG